MTIKQIITGMIIGTILIFSLNYDCLSEPKGWVSDNMKTYKVTVDSAAIAGSSNTIVAANTSLRELHINNRSAYSILIGSACTDVELLNFGYEIKSSSSIVLKTQAAIHAISTFSITTDITNIYILELY